MTHTIVVNSVSGTPILGFIEDGRRTIHRTGALVSKHGRLARAKRTIVQEPKVVYHFVDFGNESAIWMSGSGSNKEVGEVLEQLYTDRFGHISDMTPITLVATYSDGVRSYVQTRHYKLENLNQ